MPVPIERTDYRLDRVVGLGELEELAAPTGATTTLAAYTRPDRRATFRPLVVFGMRDAGNGVFVFAAQFVSATSFTEYDYRGVITLGSGIQVSAPRGFVDIASFVAVPEGFETPGRTYQRGVPAADGLSVTWSAGAYALAPIAIFAATLASAPPFPVPADAVVVELILDRGQGGGVRLRYDVRKRVFAQRLDSQSIVTGYTGDGPTFRILTETVDYIMRDAPDLLAGFVQDNDTLYEVVSVEPLARGRFHRVTVQREVLAAGGGPLA